MSPPVSTMSARNFYFFSPGRSLAFKFRFPTKYAKFVFEVAASWCVVNRMGLGDLHPHLESGVNELKSAHFRMVDTRDPGRMSGDWIDVEIKYSDREWDELTLGDTYSAWTREFWTIYGLYFDDNLSFLSGFRVANLSDYAH